MSSRIFNGFKIQTRFFSFRGSRIILPNRLIINSIGCNYTIIASLKVNTTLRQFQKLITFNFRVVNY
ncbi:hypothetical protein TU75_26140 [Pseudomonas poae]|uniref:Mechanosensitive ion channel n=1 Tax=Pseudomonas poae TaxID=200451 RepID=A0ABY0RKZ5_9PSED|nr:hypothetical protein TU75_26140 [Pseudomonas poae]KTC27496.1 hypothetical protein AO260_28905 [Pseudomonas sp. ABAC21]SDO23828.1 hypothetical protein SAMN04490208_3056 [Pseudomonas poae]